MSIFVLECVKQLFHGSTAMFPRSAVLTKEQKTVVKHALFQLQKEYYNKLGEIPPKERKLINDIITNLHLRDENY